MVAKSAMTSSTARVERGAQFDRTGLYRYALQRSWDLDGPAVAFVMLNPSTADATRDDPTIRRCMGFARTLGYGSLEVVNLFAYRAVHPGELRRAPDPIGPENDRYLLEAASRAQLLVAGWGRYGSLHNRDRAVVQLLGSRLHCLDTTRSGQPSHPLYLARSARPVLWQAPVPPLPNSGEGVAGEGGTCAS